MKISYTKKENCLIPNLELKKKKKNNIGKYGTLRLKYLKEYKKTLYTNLLMKDELNGYLCELDKLVNDKVNELIIKLAETENINEKLKSTNQLEWVKQMNNIKNRAEEIAINEYICEDII